MTTHKSKEKARSEIKTGMLGLTDIKTVPKKAIFEKWPIIGYKYRYTTGPFLLPQNSGSLDWTLLNNDNTQQQARVTVFKCPVGAVKAPEVPGPIVVTIDPGESTHNANTYVEGFSYEIQVECNSRLVLPYVSVWPANFGVVIPGTGICSGSFIRRMP